MGIAKMARLYDAHVCAAAATVLLLGSTTVQADDFIVSTETTELNGNLADHVLDGGDSLTITPGGAIRVEGVNTSVSGTRDVGGTGNRVLNQGTIEVTLTGEGEGFLVSGMLSHQNDHLAINDGTIRVLEVLGPGPAADTNANGIAQPLAAGASINNGLVFVDSYANAGAGNASGRSSGIRGHGNITNTGTVVVHSRASSEESSASTGVFGLRNSRPRGPPSVVTNSGEIRVTAEAFSPTFASAVAVGLSSENEIRNSGKITVGGWANGVAADPNDPNHLIAAIDANSGGYAIYLDAPSYFGGPLLLEAEGPEEEESVPVTITTGASHSILWDLHNTDTALLTVVDDLVPAFSDTGDWATATRIATFDPTLFAARSPALADRAGEIGGLMRARRDAAGEDPCAAGGGGADLPAYAYEEPAAGCTLQPGTTAWVAAFGRVMDYDGAEATLDHTTKTYGGAGGFDWVNGNGLTLGAMIGYGAETMDASSRWSQSYDNKADGFFAGAYGRAGAGPVFVDLDVAGGYLDHDDSRFVNDNLAQDSTGFFDGASWRSADYDSWWARIGAAIGTDIAMGAWTLTPRVGGFYAMEWIDGFSETGGDAGATVASQNVGVAEGHVELALSRMVMANARFTGRGGYFARTSTGDDGVDVTIYGTTESVPTDADDAAGFYAGGDLVVDLPGSAVFEIGGSAFFGEDVSGYQGNASLGIQF
jgi:hypothetical protein